MLITRIVAGNPGPFTGAGTNTYVVISNDASVVIDPGPMIESHLAVIRAAVERTRVVGVLVTHHHLDHSPAANPLAEQYGVPSYGFGSYGGFQAISAVADGDRIHVGADMIEVLHTPGHTPDSLCFAAPDGLFTGDTIKAGTTVVVEDMSDYMATLQRLAALSPPRIFPGHGEVIDDPASVLAGYIAHRKMREAAIATALEAGGRLDIGGVVRAVYPELDEALIPLAMQSATAHLEKLVVDGVVVREGDRWMLR
jgi:glyoxylase-like metal-dependent hydrolase (beta-lactamase superfamily II)